MSRYYIITLPDGRPGVTEIPLLSEGHDADLAPISADMEEAHQLYALAKTQFELGRSKLENAALSGEALEHWRRNVKFDAYDGPPIVLPYRACDITEIPADRTFREAWENGSTEITVNMVKARAIHMERIRKVRDVELAKLDTPFRVALGKNDTVKLQQIEQKAEALRHIPQTFDLSVYKTPLELKAAWPDELPK